MNRIRKIVYCACGVCVVTLGSCVRNEVEPSEFEDRLVPIELVGLTGAAEITRAGIDQSFTDIKTATIIVFNSDGTEVLQRRNLNYAAGDRVYLKTGASYNVFAVANLSDGNCPNGDWETYFNDVYMVGGLSEKLLLSTVTAGAAPSTTTGMPMTSIDSYANQIAIVEVPDPIVIGESDVVTIKMRSIYTKVALTIYNKSDSGVTPQSYLVENLPIGSWIVERQQAYANHDYADYLAAQTPPQAGYVNSSLTSFSPAASEWSTAPAPLDNYKMHSFDIYTLENRRGPETAPSADMDARRDNAPANALDVTIIGAANNKMLYTHVLVGKGRNAAIPTDDALGNYDVDRNCIYHVNVYINGTANVEVDTRREYLDVVAVCGDLTSPVDGTEVEF
jgi:hypothetical protein